MKKVVFIAAVAVLLAACAKKQKALTLEETVVETPPSVQHTATVTEPAANDDGSDRESHLPIYFGYNSSELDDDSRVALARLAAAMKKDASLMVTIEGHCDERGTTEFNLALGERRAKSARAYLLKMGVPGSRIDLVSYGEERPAAQGEGERAWALNRRDEFVVSQN